MWAKEIATLHDELFADPQVMPSLHHYFSEDVGFARLASYPTVVDGKSYDHAALEKTLDGKYDQRRIARPVMVGEFGVFRGFPQPFAGKSLAQPFATQLAITRDLVSIFEEKGWSWTMWCYKDLHDMGMLTVNPDTPWRRFLESEQIAGFMRRYRDLEKPFTQSIHSMLGETDILVDARDQWIREVSRAFDVPALDYILRRLAVRPLPEIAEMARSFAFASCEIHQDQLATMMPFLTHS
jgi:hypothetical protein